MCKTVSVLRWNEQIWPPSGSWYKTLHINSHIERVGFRKVRGDTARNKHYSFSSDCVFKLFLSLRRSQLENEQKYMLVKLTLQMQSNSIQLWFSSIKLFRIKIFPIHMPIHKKLPTESNRPHLILSSVQHPMLCMLLKLLGRTPWVFFLFKTILFVKKLMRSSLLRLKGVHVSTELWVFVSLATVLKRNLRLLLLYYIIDE